MKQGKKVGVVKVRLYRPFVAEKLVEAIPDTAKVINVLDRSKEPGAREPLYLDVVNALRGTKFESCTINGGRYGLGSKDTTPADIIATFENVDKNEFTLSIVDDVTNLSLERGETPVTAPDSIVACNSGDLEPTVLLVLTRTLSRSLVTIQTNMLRHTLIMTLRSPAVLQCLTCVSDTARLSLPT